MLRDEEKDSEISKDYDFLAYEQRLKNIYHSVVKFENCLKIRCSPAPLHLSYPRQSSSPLAVQLQPIPDISRPKPNDSDGIVLTERLDNVSLKHQRPQPFNFSWNPSFLYLRSGILLPHSKPPVPNSHHVYAKSTKNTSSNRSKLRRYLNSPTPSIKLSTT
jgi:hypothetical protein